MKIASFYQNLLNQALQAAKNLEPIVFCGMFDSGTDYLFSLSIPLFEAELPNTAIMSVDLSGLTEAEEITSELCTLLGFDDAMSGIQEASKTRGVVLVLFLGQQRRIDKKLFLLLNRLRNTLGWRFSYCLFVSTRLLKEYEGNTLIEKVLKRNIIPVLPLSDKDSDVVLENYEERYDTHLPQILRIQVIRDSGGNPGLIKSLYLQARESKKWKPDILEEGLYFRLKGIADDIPEQIYKSDTP